MRGIFAILILLFFKTAAATSKSGTERKSRILERNTLLTTPQDELAMGRRYYYLRGSSGVVLANVIKTKNRNQEGVTTPPCRFKYHSKCPRNAWFTRSFPVKEAEESVWNIIGRKIIEQGVLQALALD